MVFFHAFTGCDTTSSFKNIGKKKAFEALKCYSDIEILLSDFYNNPFLNFTEDDAIFEKIQQFVIVMYSRTSPPS